MAQTKDVVKKKEAKVETKAMAGPFHDAISALVPDMPPKLVGNLVVAFRERGYETVDNIKEADSKTVIYRLGGAVRSVIRTHAVQFYKEALNNKPALASNEFVVNGIDVTGIYPDCKVSFVKRLRTCFEAQKLKELKSMADRSAPPLIENALRNSIRSANDIGLDGQYLYDVLTK